MSRITKAVKSKALIIGLHYLFQKGPFSNRENIVGAISRHQVVLVAGETGCGKTTQVPQYLLEDAWGKDKCK